MEALITRPSDASSGLQNGRGLHRCQTRQWVVGIYENGAEENRSLNLPVLSDYIWKMGRGTCEDQID